MTEYLRVFKLSNGESIIGTTLNDTELFNFKNPNQISYPLRMVIVPKVTKDGVQEALTLSPWVHPMTKTEYIDINPNSVVMTAPASYGLQKYYNHCVNNFDFHEEGPSSITGPTDLDLDDIEIEEALELLTDPDKPETIH